MNKEQLELKKKEARSNNEKKVRAQVKYSHFDMTLRGIGFCDGFDAGVEAMKAEIDGLKKKLHSSKEVGKMVVELCKNHEIKIKKMRKCLDDLVQDIETPQRLGVGEVNKDWDSLNKAKALLKELENERTI